MLDLALLNQIFYRTGNVFDRHLQIDPMLIEQIDGLDLEPLERGLGDLPDVLRAASRPALRLTDWNPNLVAITTCLRIGASASPTSSSLMNGP